jgi:hypothetical protein
MYSVRGILRHPGATEFQKQQIQNILYVAYEKWAIKQAGIFKRFHVYKCRDIALDELVLAGKWGLFKSTTNYNGQSAFISYAELYIHSELLRFMNSRLKGKKIGIVYDTNDLESNLDFDSIRSSRLDYLQGLNVDPATRRMFALKFDEDKQKIRSNKHVAELMCCSEETVRMNLNSINPESMEF